LDEFTKATEVGSGPIFLPPGFCPEDLPPGFCPENLPPGFCPEKMKLWKSPES